MGEGILILMEKSLRNSKSRSNAHHSLMRMNAGDCAMLIAGIRSSDQRVYPKIQWALSLPDNRHRKRPMQVKSFADENEPAAIKQRRQVQRHAQTEGTYHK